MMSSIAAQGHWRGSSARTAKEDRASLSGTGVRDGPRHRLSVKVYSDVHRGREPAKARSLLIAGIKSPFDSAKSANRVETRGVRSARCFGQISSRKGEDALAPTAQNGQHQPTMRRRGIRLSISQRFEPSAFLGEPRQRLHDIESAGPSRLTKDLIVTVRLALN
jgi:hypothetical protein